MSPTTGTAGYLSAPPMQERQADYGINYKTCIFAAHKQINYGWIVGHAFTDSKDFYKLVLRAKAEKADFIKLMISVKLWI